MNKENLIKKTEKQNGSYFERQENIYEFCNENDISINEFYNLQREAHTLEDENYKEKVTLTRLNGEAIVTHTPPNESTHSDYMFDGHYYTDKDGNIIGSGGYTLYNLSSQSDNGSASPKIFFGTHAEFIEFIEYGSRIFKGYSYLITTESKVDSVKEDIEVPIKELNKR